MTSMAHVLVQSGEQRPGLARVFGYIGRYLMLAFRLRAERDQLANLTQEQLDDIGITWRDADAESKRLFLDIPAHRRSRLYL